MRSRSGNPGAADFYIPFLSALHELCDGTVEIFAGWVARWPVSLGAFLADASTSPPRPDACKGWPVEHAGHSVLEGHETARPMHVVEQIQHKAALLDYLYRENPRRRFLLAGHSVGAYICVEVSSRTRPQGHQARPAAAMDLTKGGSAPAGEGDTTHSC